MQTCQIWTRSLTMEYSGAHCYLSGLLQEGFVPTRTSGTSLQTIQIVPNVCICSFQYTTSPTTMKHLNCG